MGLRGLGLWVSGYGVKGHGSRGLGLLGLVFGAWGLGFGMRPVRGSEVRASGAYPAYPESWC